MQKLHRRQPLRFIVRETKAESTPEILCQRNRRFKSLFTKEPRLPKDTDVSAERKSEPWKGRDGPLWRELRDAAFHSFSTNFKLQKFLLKAVQVPMKKGVTSALDQRSQVSYVRVVQSRTLTRRFLCAMVVEQEVPVTQCTQYHVFTRCILWLFRFSPTIRKHAGGCL